MNRTDAPVKQSTPFAVNGQREPILPTTPAGDNTASYSDGFPAITMILKSAGGMPPKGQDMNQILFELSALARWASSGATNSWDSAFSTAIGGYPMGAVVLGTDGITQYKSTVDSNTTNPNTGGAGWFNLTAGYLKTANNLSEIAAAGSTAVAEALAHLGLVIGSEPGNIVTSGSTQPVYKTTLPNIGYADLPQKGLFAVADGIVDSVTKILTTLLTKSGTGGWTLGQSTGTYLGLGGTPDDIAHVFVSTDGGSFTRRWYLYNNGKLVGPAGDMASVSYVSSGFQPLDATLTGMSGKDAAGLRAYLELGNASLKTIGTGAGQVPDMSAWLTSASLNGYMKLPNGIYIQWYTTDLVAGPNTVNFPIPFPNNFLADAGMAGISSTVGGVSATRTSRTYQANAANTACFIAIGL